MDEAITKRYDTTVMRIQVRYFAVFKERLAKSGETIELPAGATGASLVEVLEARYPAVLALRGRYRLAHNQAMVDLSVALADGDEVALIPPVAGGAGPHARIVDAPLSLDRCLAAVAGPGMGGIVTFTGVVRDHSRGEVVTRLEYEAYTEMAERVLADLVDEVVAEFGCRVAVEHRVGSLGIGDLAVVIAAAAPHRAEAFAGCRAMIDRLKDRAPIWKREFAASGIEWVGLGP